MTSSFPLLTSLALAAFTSVMAPCVHAGIVSELALQTPTLLVFVPSTVAPADLHELSGADAWAVQALTRTQYCMGGFYVSYRFARADTIVVVDGARRTSIDVGVAAPLTGALLLKPGSPASLVFAGGGPSSLPGLVARAAGDYFQHPCDEQ